ncbi:hypothetical protein GCM10023080_057510 [Streptomyces pseudoechinosporeus]
MRTGSPNLKAPSRKPACRETGGTDIICSGALIQARWPVRVRPDCLTKGTGCGSFKPPRTYPDLRGAMTWSTNWDAAAGNAWSNAVGPHVHALP